VIFISNACKKSDKKKKKKKKKKNEERPNSTLPRKVSSEKHEKHPAAKGIETGQRGIKMRAKSGALDQIEGTRAAL